MHPPQGSSWQPASAEDDGTQRDEKREEISSRKKPDPESRAATRTRALTVRMIGLPRTDPERRLH